MTRLKSELELVKRQLNETVIQLKAEQDKTDISNTTYFKHAELLKKVRNIEMKWFFKLVHFLY